MRDFTLRVGDYPTRFRFGVDFTEGERRLCWTLPGINKLIQLGLWKREFDGRGNLISKPMRVEILMRNAGAAPA